MLHSLGERGIARVAGSVSSVESRWVGFIQSGSELQPPWQIWVGQKGSAVCDSVGMPGSYCFLALEPVISAIHNVETFPKCSQVSRYREILLVASFAVLRPFHDVKVPEPKTVEFCNRDGEGFEWVVVRHIVKVNRWRDSHTDLLPVPNFQHLFDCFREKADSIRRNTSIFISSVIRSCSEKLIDQVSIRRMNLDPVKSGFFRVARCPPIVVQGSL